MRLFAEVAQETRGVLLAMALLALPALKTWRTRPASWRLAGMSMLVVGAMLVVLRMRAGFLSSRYLTPIVPFIAAAAVFGAERMLTAWRLWAAKRFVGSHWIHPASAAALFLLVAALCAPGWFRPLHAHRASHMAAARWLKEHASHGDQVLDSTWLVGFFAELPPWNGVEAPPRWIIADPSQIKKADARTQRIVAAAAAERLPQSAFAKRAASNEFGVVIYEAPALWSQRRSEVWK
jgi:hypothetical protein